ncbi:MAG: hypothetical protein IKL68_00875 [Clostridia bacterium]|nr:hypothetical protein [Clostridia bacterium]
MNNTDYKSLEITDEEIGALRRYISNAHISMNALLDIDPEVINTQLSKGWVIDFSKKGIDTNVEYLTKLYSAMYKYSLQGNKGRTTVYRGTSKSEVTKLEHEKISGRFLSTTTDRDIAMRFTEYRNGALFAMSLDNVPYISTDAFLDETQVSESEILVSPFSKIEGIEAYSFQDIEGVTRYSANVKKQEFANISDEERKQYEEQISSFNYEENLAKYKDLSFKAEIMADRIVSLRGAKTKDEREELAYMMERQSELLNELNEVSAGFKTVKTAMTAILQDRFKTVELEIDRELEQDKKEFENEERKRKVELERERKATLLRDADKVLTGIDLAKEAYETKDAKEVELYSKAEELGLDVSKVQTVDPTTLAKFEELKVNIERIKREIEAIEIPDNMTNEEMAVTSEHNAKINDLHTKLSMTVQMLRECEKTIFEQKGKSKALLSREVATRLGQDLTSKAREDLLKEEQTLEAKKDSLWDKITGKSKIKAAQIENIRLRRELIERGGLGLPSSMEEMTTYATKYKEVLGESSLPESVRGIIPRTNTDIVVTYEEREQIEAARPGTSLIPIDKSKKEILSVLDSQNTTLKARIQSTHIPSSKRAIPELEIQTKNSVERCLDTALYYTTDMPEEQRDKIIKDRVTIG